MWQSLTEWQRARYRASQSVFGNRPRPVEYAYSLRSCLADYQAHKEGEIEQKTLSRCAVSVDSYLGNRRDIAMPLMSRASVFDWLDRISQDDKSVSGKKTMVSNLRQMFRFRFGQREDRSNHREIHSTTTNSRATPSAYTAMDDETLAKILNHIPVELRLPAIVARYSGMRLSRDF